MSNVTVVPIPHWVRRFFKMLPGWKETDVSNGKKILKHSHSFWAMYFVFDVTYIETAATRRCLPTAAIVIVPPGKIHGWATNKETNRATVGHFHRGHPAHVTDLSGVSPA